MKVDIKQQLIERGAVLKGHFLLSSGRHSDTYFEKFRLLEDPALLSDICAEIVERFSDSGAEVVVGPTTGGIIVAFEVARQMGLRALYVEREGGKRALRRGSQIFRGTKALVVDDVLTTGGSVREVVELVRSNGATVVGVGVLVDRSEDVLDFGTPLFAAAKVDAKSYAPEEVPAWLSAIPISEPGSSRL